MFSIDRGLVLDRGWTTDDSCIELDLLDSSVGLAIQTWRFEGRDRIGIGRSEEMDVRIVDPRVSRLHVELLYESGAWTLVALGRNGVYIDGQPTTRLRLPDKSRFQLGVGGPVLRMRCEDLASSTMATVENIDPSMIRMLYVDEKKRDTEVQQITETQLFQQLKQRAEEMRRR